MKLVRYGEAGAEKPGMLDAQGGIRDLSNEIEDITGDIVTEKGFDRLRALKPDSLPLVEGTPRLGPCVAQVGKLVCIGLNYSDHAAESGVPVPEEPVIFMKATSCICGPDDPIIIPRGSVKTDWEVELAFVIGREARYIDQADWRDYIAGYCVVNDVSERAYQLESPGQWVKGKSADSFGPVGPWLVTADEIPEVDGKRYQDGNTNTMVFDVAHLLSDVSQYMSLQPGDIISTGTPPGVGMGQKPQTYLRPGQTVRLGIAGLGEQNHTVIAAQ